jgi:hypothetical protein
MLSILDETTHPADRVSRRESLGVSLADVLRAAAPPAAQPGSTPRLAGDLGSTFGKARPVPASCKRAQSRPTTTGRPGKPTTAQDAGVSLLR